MQRLVCMGGFKNQRDVFEWEGETLELDQTMYEWGTLYEIEVETVRVARGVGVRPGAASFVARGGCCYACRLSRLRHLTAQCCSRLAVLPPLHEHAAPPPCSRHGALAGSRTRLLHRAGAPRGTAQQARELPGVQRGPVLVLQDVQVW